MQTTIDQHKQVHQTKSKRINTITQNKQIKHHYKYLMQTTLLQALQNQNKQYKAKQTTNNTHTNKHSRTTTNNQTQHQN